MSIQHYCIYKGEYRLAFMLTSAIRRFVGPTIVGEIERGIDLLNEASAVKTLVFIAGG